MIVLWNKISYFYPRVPMTGAFQPRDCGGDVGAKGC